MEIVPYYPPIREVPPSAHDMLADDAHRAVLLSWGRRMDARAAAFGPPTRERAGLVAAAVAAERKMFGRVVTNGLEDMRAGRDGG